MLIAFSGCDGSGKSTQVARAFDALSAAGRSVEVVNKWQIMDPERLPECRFIGGPLDDLRVCIAEMEGAARALFLFFSMAITLRRAELLRDPECILLLDGYWMKHAAAEIEYGCDANWIEAVVSCFRQPDLTFYFDVDGRTALSRKGELTPYECGRDPARSARKFLAHQARVRRRLQTWARDRAWVQIAAGRPVDEVASEVCERLEAWLSQRRRNVWVG